jgi:uncharacterized protein
MAGQSRLRFIWLERYIFYVSSAMLFSWDERQENWALRKVDLLEAALIFEDPEIIESVDPRTDDGEERIQALGETNGTFYVLAYTWRGDARHLITAWKVGEHGRRRYQAVFARRDQADEGGGPDTGDTGGCA